MYIKNRKNYSQGLFSLSLCLILFLSLFINAQGLSGNSVVEFKTSSNLNVRIIKNNSMGYLYSEIVIFFNESGSDSLTRFVLKEILFDGRYHSKGYRLNKILKDLGNDFEVDLRPDCLNIKVSFLEKNINDYLLFVKELFNTDGFTVKITPAIKKIGKNFVNNKKNTFTIVKNFAYKSLFSDTGVMGRSVVDYRKIRDITGVKVADAYRKIFRLENSLLLLKGELSPYSTMGKLETNFRSYKSRKRSSFQSDLKVSRGKRIFVLNREYTKPRLYIFRAVPSVLEESYLSSEILNTILFGFPTGIVVNKSGFFGIKDMRVKRDTYYHNRVSVICNSITLKKYSQIERFLQVLDREEKKIKIAGIARNDYLRAFNLVYGETKIQTIKPNYGFDFEIMKFLCNYPADLYFEAVDTYFKGLTIQKVRNYIEQKNTGQNFLSDAEVIVVVGSQDKIVRNLRIYNPLVVKVVY